MAKPPTSVRSIRLPDDLWERLSAKAKERGKNVNAAVAHAVEEWMAIPDYVVREGPAPTLPPETQGLRATMAEALKSGEAALAARRDQAARDAKYARRDTWDPRFAASPKKGRK